MLARRLPVFSGSMVSKTNAAVITAFNEMCFALDKVGLSRQPDMTPQEYAEFAEDRFGASFPTLAGSIRSLAELHMEFRYSARVANADDVAAAQSNLEKVRQAIRQCGKKALLGAVLVCM